jgi:hypothetical protein
VSFPPNNLYIECKIIKILAGEVFFGGGDGSGGVGNGKLILKFIRTCEGPRISQNNFDKWEQNQRI